MTPILLEYAMQSLRDSIVKDDVKEAVFWLSLLANNGAPKTLSETVH